jgi:polyisoprenyl-phosphate glycosyltransferase
MTINNIKISIVVPILNEEGNIELLIQKVTNILENYSGYELLFVDDGSTDNTLDIVREKRRQNNKIQFLSFSRNFGHQNALRAGLDFATGDCVISMDGDLQHPPELIPELIEKWQEGCDIVYTIRKEDPNLPYLKRKTAGIFYGIMNRFSDIKVDKGAADFRLMDRSVVEVMKTIKENNIFMRGMISWLGFKQCGVEYSPDERHWGETKYTFKKMVKFAMEGITSFSIKPLRISTIFGYIFAALSFLYGIYAIFIKLFTNNTVSGWTSLLAGILFIGGIQMIMIGILGEYIGKLFIESKKRPNYIIKEKSYD